MNTHSTTGLRCLAFAGGLVFLGGTVIQVYGDVIKGAAITEKHLLSAVIIIGAILVGHVAVEAWRVKRRGSSLAFWGIFLACTGLVVLMSVGRQGETMAWSQAQADAAEDARRDARLGLKKAQGMLAEAQTNLAKECASGQGKRCDGIRSTISIYEGSAAGHQATLDKLGPPKLVAPEEEQFAKLVATFFSVDQDRVKAGTIMAKPFFVSAVCEFGVILCFGFAFRGDRKLEEPKWEPSEGDRRQTSFPLPADLDELRRLTTVSARNLGNSGNGGGRKVFCREEAEADLVTRLALGETVAAQDDLANRWGVNKSTVSKWLKNWEREQLIPARQQIGRTKQLAAA